MNRNYQDRAITNAVTEWDNGVSCQLNVMATGSGKTHCFAQFPKAFETRLPGQTLVLAHREELIDQAIAKIRVENPLLRVDKEKAEHVADPSQADIIVASVGSMTEKRRLKFNATQVDKITIDEAHHSTADSYLSILDYFNVGSTSTRLPKSYLLNGWTATPQRGDGEALAKVYSKIVNVYTIRDAIEDGWLVHVRGYRVRTDTSLDNVGTVAGDFNQKKLADTVDTPGRNLQAYKAWMKLAEDRQTIGFCVNIEHAKNLAEMFRQNNVLADYIWGEDPERAAKLVRFREGEIEVLFNCDLLTEGFDMWQVECVMNLAPTKSPVKYIQRVGRGTRLEFIGKEYRLTQMPSNAQIKRDCIVIDLVDNCTRNSLITLPTLMGLPADLDLKGESMTWAAKKLEEAQEQFPYLDLTKLPDISKLDQYIQEVNLFDVVFKPEVEQSSELSWHSAAGGGYILLLPEKESITIRQNLLDKFEIRTVLGGQKYAGERGTLEDAFKAADGLILKHRSNAFRLVKQKQGWHNEPATDAQRKTLRKFMKGKQIPVDLNKGKASRLISAYLAGKS